MNVDPSNPTHRAELVKQVRDMVQQHFPNKGWYDRCPHVAFHTVYVLKGYGLTGFKIVAGRLEEVGSDPPVVLFEGTYTGTGESQFHTWIVGPEGQKIDFSIVPERYGKPHLWEDYETLPNLKYIEVDATTQAVNEKLRATYSTAADEVLGNHDTRK